MLSSAACFRRLISATTVSSRAPTLFKASPPALRPSAPPSRLVSAAAADGASPSTPAAAGPRSALDEMDPKGAFQRTPSVFRSNIEPDGRFPPEAGRYHLYVSHACPWANRCAAALRLNGLEKVIGLSVVHPTWQRTRPGDPSDEHCGWVFRKPDDAPLASSTGHGSFPCIGCISDDVNGAASVRDLYEMAGDTGGKYSVPLLWDKTTKTIVNNESSEILRIFNSAFNGLAASHGVKADVDLYPADLRAEIDGLNEWIYPAINNGVYRCGFAMTQQAYEQAYDELFAALNRCESILSKRRYLCGDRLTEADVRLFMTLIRFDPVYVVYFKTNKKFIREYPVISDYVRDLYQTPGIKEAIDIGHIKTHYFTSHPKLNYYAVIPKGPEAWWEGAHNRSRMTKTPVAFVV